MLFSALPARPGPVRPRARVGLLWRRHDHRHPGPPLARHRRRRARRSGTPRAPRRRGRRDPIAVTAPASCFQLPVELLREVVDFELPPPCAGRDSTPLPRVSASCRRIPVARADARERVEAIAAAEGLRHRAGLAHGARRPGRRRGRRDGAELYALHVAVVRRRTRTQRRPARRHRPRAVGVPAAQARRNAVTCTSRRCPAGPWPTRAC